MKKEITTIEELYDLSDIIWDGSDSPEDQAAARYAQIDYDELRDGKLVQVNKLDDLLEPFATRLIDALGIKPTDKKSMAIYRALSQAFGSGCITTKRQDHSHLKAATNKRTQESIESKALLWSEFKRLRGPSYKELSEHMSKKHGIDFKPSTIGVYIRRRMKQADKK